MPISWPCCSRIVARARSPSSVKLGGIRMSTMATSGLAEAMSAVSTVDRLHMEVSDDGVGGADPASGSGLRGLADRVAALGGRLEIHSPPGGGTRLMADLPFEAEGVE